MDHLQPFRARKIMALPTIADQGWRLKQYAIIADERYFDETITGAAALGAIKRLPSAGTLQDTVKNHGIGFQIVHFAQTAVVSPVFYWQWGSVLGKIDQIRASWDTPTEFGDGVAEILGCIWEMDVVSFETNAWKTTLLDSTGPPEARLSSYLDQHLTL